MRGKKAGERYLSPWMFINWFIIGIVIVIGVIIFLNAKGDMRGVESEVIAKSLFDCLSTDFSYNELTNNFDIYNKCNLNRKIIEERGIFYFSVYLQEIDGASFRRIGDEKLIAEGGAIAFREDCKIQIWAEEEKKGQFASLPKCTYLFENVFDKQIKKNYEISIVTASNQDD